MNPRRLLSRPLFWLSLYFVWGLLTLDTIGVHYDELTQRYIGIQSNKYIVGTASRAEIEEHSFFGPVFESFCYLSEQVLGPNASMRSRLLLRRFWIWTLFVWALYAFYGLLRKRFGPTAAFWSLGLMALWPNLWAHAHVNSKDVVFLSLQILAIAALWRYREDSGRKWSYLLAFAVLAAWAASIRLVGVCLLGLAPLLLARERASRRPALALIGMAALALWLSFPVLWVAPWKQLGTMMKYAVQNPWPNPSLFLGHELPPTAFTRAYLPVWMLLTLPLGFLFWWLWGLIKVREWTALLPSSAAGMGGKSSTDGASGRAFYEGFVAGSSSQTSDDQAAGAGLEKGRASIAGHKMGAAFLHEEDAGLEKGTTALEGWTASRSQGFGFLDALFLGSFFLPLLLVLLLNPVLYNHWRHFYFLVVPMTYMAAGGLSLKESKLQQRRMRGIMGLYLVSLALVSLVSPWKAGFWFNELYTQGLQPYMNVGMTQDYWGLSTQKALGDLRAISPKKSLKIACLTELIELNAQLWPSEQVWACPLQQADYYFDYNREGSWAWPQIRNHRTGFGQLILEYKQGEESVLRVYDLHARTAEISL